MEPRIVENMEIMWFVVFEAFSSVAYFPHIFSISPSRNMVRICKKCGKHMVIYGNMENMENGEMWKTYENHYGCHKALCQGDGHALITILLLIF